MSLTVLKPTAITLDAQLLSSSATESADATWSSGTTYAEGATVKYNHVRYESRAGSNTNHLPTELNSTWWLELGPTNQWAMFDSQVSTSTEDVGSLVVEVKLGAVFNSAAVLGVTGASTVQVEVFKDSGRTAASLVYDDTKSLDNTFISDWYQYYFEPYEVTTDLLFGAMETAVATGGFPPYANGELRLTITGNTVGTTVTCGSLLLGTTVELGKVVYGAGAGINDYSVKTVDGFGQYTLVQRSFAKRANYTFVTTDQQMRRVYSTLAELRATPCVWAASTDYKLSPLTVFGFYKDFSLVVPYPGYSTFNLEVEGLT